MNVYRYPGRSLIGDYIRSFIGLAVGIGALLSVPLSPAIIAIFGALTVLFLVFGLRTVQRQLMKVAVTNDEICSAGLGTRILPWTALERLKLRYYGTRRPQQGGLGGGGFMQLTLKGGGASMTLESSIDGFEYIARCAAKAARENGVSLDPTSAGNLLDLGIDADSDRSLSGG
ncbi:MAG: hypothetical protein ACE5KF_02175 [Kiloniellaceae bacterium]